MRFPPKEKIKNQPRTEWMLSCLCITIRRLDIGQSSHELPSLANGVYWRGLDAKPDCPMSGFTLPCVAQGNQPKGKWFSRCTQDNKKK
ncbi:hypothetical protein FQN60_013200 [Etheostoma spectabile]|uniref:Uncharacterized protein n=1 Tax=Etheostoma spectabile TaxID=54343 RepID=A0A5J5DAZ3_9PERO|nr:hypothetical protein FQN60_013200 [Etheostoma spectabile]